MSEIEGLASMAKVQAMSTGLAMPVAPKRVDPAPVRGVTGGKVELKKEADGSVDVDALMKTIGGALSDAKKDSSADAGTSSSSNTVDLLSGLKDALGGN